MRPGILLLLISWADECGWLFPMFFLGFSLDITCCTGMR